MMAGVAYGRTIALACALFALTHAADVRARRFPGVENVYPMKRTA